MLLLLDACGPSWRLDFLLVGSLDVQRGGVAYGAFCGRPLRPGEAELRHGRRQHFYAVKAGSMVTSQPVDVTAANSVSCAVGRPRWATTTCRRMATRCFWLRTLSPGTASTRG